MKAAGLISLVFFGAILLSGAGCDSSQNVFGRLVTAKPPAEKGSGLDVSIYASYAPAKLDISPLTELVSVGDDKRTLKINLYVSLIDSFGSQIKSPGVFRFELHEYVQRSADPKGARFVIWPDIDLTDPPKNNEYWRDFLRAYEFNLDFEADKNQTYVLHVTCLCPAQPPSTSSGRKSAEPTLPKSAGKRFSSDVVLKLAK
jgi:hypothetical protein